MTSEIIFVGDDVKDLLKEFQLVMSQKNGGAYHTLSAMLLYQ